MITLEDWALIRRSSSGEGLAKTQLATQLGISRNTVATAIASVDPPSCSRPPAMAATVLAERVGWEGSATWFRRNVVRIRPDYAPTDPAERIVTTRAIRCSATCGSPLDEHSGVPTYDLIAVTGDHGKQGCIHEKKSATIGDNDPEADDLKNEGELKLPVYAADSVTQIDTSTIGDRPGFIARCSGDEGSEGK